jgi:hypothetical protein
VAADHDRAGLLALVELDLAQRALEAMLVVHPVGQLRVLDRAPRVGRVGGEEHLALAQPQDHRQVAGGVPGGGDDPDAAVAEQVERAAEGGVGVRVRGLEVERLPVEGVVELPRPVPLEPAARPRGLPLGARHHEGRVGELRDAARVVRVQVRHHDHAHLGRLDAELAELGRQRLPGLHPDVLDHTAGEATERLVGRDRDRGMEARVHEDPAGAGMLDEESHDGHLGPLLARHADPQRAQRG